ncbi:MAG: AAA family ATPase [Gammaproteobacteria bacterium]|nr:AAA family ATPase [Gammaproteobacteria bacterium]
MILKRLNINRLPGIDSPFQVEFKGSGFHIIHGPNGIGKSSLCKAVEQLYWNDSKVSTTISVTGQFEIDGVLWSIERDGKSHHWSRIDGQESDPPEPPPLHQAKCFFLQLRDLIVPSEDGLSDIATQINRQMAGGFDLDAVVDLYPMLTKHRTRSLSKAFSNASLDIEIEQREQSNLQSRQDHLETLEKELVSAREETNREASIDRALGLLEKRNEVNRMRVEFNSFSSEVGKLRGDEIERLDKIEKKVQSYSEDIKRLNLDVASALDEQGETQLSEPLDSDSLTTQKSRADKLVRLEDLITTIKIDIASQKGRLSRAMDAIGGTVNIDRQLQLKEHGQLYELLGRCVSTHNREEIIKIKIELLDKSTANKFDESNTNTVQLESAISSLRMWLRASSFQKPSSTTTSLKRWMIAGVVLGIFGWGLAYVVSSSFLLLAGAGLGLLALSLLLFQSNDSSPTTSESREEAETNYRLTKHAEPDQWDVPSVKNLLAQLENQLSKLSATVQFTQKKQDELETLKHELEGVQADKKELDIECRALAEELDLQHIPDMELVDYARALDHIREVQITLAGLEAKRLESKNSHAGELRQLTDYLAQYVGNEPRNGLEAKAAIDSLSDRSNRLKQALSEEKTALRQIERINPEKEQAEQNIRDIYMHLSLEQGDTHKLKEMLDQQEEYIKLRDQVSKLESQIELVVQELNSANEADLENLSFEELKQLKEQSEEARQKVEDISGEISEIQTLTNQVKQGNSMQDLIAKREDARSNLQDGLDTQLQSQAVKFLISQVKDQYEQRHIPPLFERAKSHFARFTRNAYELQLGRHDGKPALRAMELHTGKLRELDHLSDGTRVQLLIAARIAFAEEVERGLKLPFFLDEALDQSDPQRFEAIVGCLGQVSTGQKRQMIYLTSDPVDQIRIENALELAGCKLASVIDLGEIRKMSVSVDDASKLEIQSEKDIPAPSGQPYSQYIVDLAVPAFMPTQGWFGQSVSYVLPEDHDLLYRFHKNGIHSAGQWSIVENQPLASELCEGILTPEEVGNRIELLKVFCDLWSLGRGRPLDRHDLENSNAITDRFIQEVSDIAREIQGDASRLIEILRERKDKRSSGLRKNQIEKLEQYFLNNGQIDDRSVLDEDGLLLRVRATPAADKLPESTSLDLIRKWQALADRFSGS